MPVDRKRLKDIVSRINTSSKAEFVKRLINNTNGYIPTGDGSVMTHRLGYVEDGDTAVVFPEVQSVGESLAEFYYPMSYERAVANGDTVHMSIPDAELFTQHYKEEYPQFKQYVYGGDTDEEEYFDIMPAATITAELPDIYKSGGQIHIKPENRGKFTALKKRTGHSATWFKEHGTPAQRKMATFALNSKHWSHKHTDGGYLQDYRQSYELGGIYDLSEEQVQELIRQGYEVERV